MDVNSAGPANWQKISDIIQKSGYALDQYGNRMEIVDALEGPTGKQIREVVENMGPGQFLSGQYHPPVSAARAQQKVEVPGVYESFVRALKATSYDAYRENLVAAHDDVFFRRAVLEARLRKIITYEGFTTARAGDDIVVFFVRDDEVFVIRDPVALYPSDELVAKFKLLEGKP